MMRWLGLEPEDVVNSALALVLLGALVWWGVSA